jgi:hypothetical protein
MGVVLASTSVIHQRHLASGSGVWENSLNAAKSAGMPTPNVLLLLTKLNAISVLRITGWVDG